MQLFLNIFIFNLTDDFEYDFTFKIVEIKSGTHDATSSHCIVHCVLRDMSYVWHNDPNKSFTALRTCPRKSWMYVT